MNNFVVFLTLFLENKLQAARDISSLLIDRAMVSALVLGVDKRMHGLKE